MFVNFFYELKSTGIPVSPTAFLTLHRALAAGLVASLEDFYVASRAILLKSERWFDLFDGIFAHHFHGAEMPDALADEMDEAIRMLLGEWLKDPRQLAEFLGMDESALAKLTPEELEAYFKARLQDQTGRHDGGNKWIGTGGTSPVGHRKPDVHNVIGNAGRRHVPEQIGRQGRHGTPIQGLLHTEVAHPVHGGGGPETAAAYDPRRPQGPGECGRDHLQDP